MRGLAHRSNGNRSDHGNEVNTEIDHFGGEFGKPVKLPLGCANFKTDTFVFDPTEITKSRLEALHWIGRACYDNADPFHGAAPLRNSSRGMLTRALRGIGKIDDPLVSAEAGSARRDRFAPGAFSVFMNSLFWPSAEI